MDDAVEACLCCGDIVKVSEVVDKDVKLVPWGTVVCSSLIVEVILVLDMVAVISISGRSSSGSS